MKASAHKIADLNSVLKENAKLREENRALSDKYQLSYLNYTAQHKELAAAKVELQAYQAQTIRLREQLEIKSSIIEELFEVKRKWYLKNLALTKRNYQLVKANRIYFAVGTAGTIIGFLLGWLVV